MRKDDKASFGDVCRALALWVAIGSIIWIVAWIAFTMADAAYASAAENSVLAENSVITEKPAALCPTEFDLADSAWLLHRIDKPVLQKLGEEIAVPEYSTLFSYFPDPEQRAEAETNRWSNRDCVAQLFAYGSGIERQNVWAAIRAYGKLTVFLFADSGWEKGGEEIPETLIIGDADNHVLLFVLQRNGEIVASRALPVEQIKLQ